MTNEKIFEMLQDIECELFHKCGDMTSTDPGYEAAKKAHEAARESLVCFYKFMKESEK